MSPQESPDPGNAEIADALARIAALLERTEANPFRVNAYEKAAQEVRSLDQPLARLYARRGRQGLTNIPGIGASLAGVIAELIETGRSSMLEKLEGETSPRELFGRLPGIGEELADKIVRDLSISSLEELEQAAHNGRLAEVPGFGKERVEAVKDILAGRLARPASRKSGRRKNGESDPGQAPSVELLLSVDAEYRRRAEKGDLRKIAPKRFNPENEAWLPIMEKEAEGWSFTVLFSNTARAHELGATHDWVVIYFSGGAGEDQCTAATGSRAPLEGKRVIRGREAECREYYRSQEGVDQ